MTTVIGVDIGTTTISINLLERGSGRVLKSITLPNNSALRRQEQFSDLQDPDAIYNIVNSVLEELVSERDVCSIGITGQMHGIVYLNSTGQAVSPLYTWRDARGDIPCTLSSGGKSFAAHLSELTGYAMASGYGFTTHYYNTVMDTVPKETACFCSIQDYIVMRLVNSPRPLVHISNAASFGLFDFDEMKFDIKAVERAGMSADFLPETISKNTVAGMYKQSIPVAVAIGDNQASFLGSVQDMENSVLVNVGTGSQITFATKEKNNFSGLELRPCVDGYMIYAGSSLCGGRALALLEEFFRKTAELVTQKPVASAYPGIDAYLEQWLNKNAECAAEKDALYVSTKFCGTREHPMERGAIRNIGTENFTPERMIVGFLYGMADELLEMYKCAGVKHSVLVGAGNGLRKNRVLRKMMEEAFGQRLYVPNHIEEAAYGAALYSLVCAGYCKNIREAQDCITYEMHDNI